MSKQLDGVVLANNRQKIVLTPTDSSLVGKIYPTTEHCHILLDSVAGPFTVTLPDASGSMQRELIFKNIGANDVTLQPLTGQYLDYSKSHVLNYLDLVNLWPDGLKTWWMLDNNASTVPAAHHATHEPGGSDEIGAWASAALASDPTPEVGKVILYRLASDPYTLRLMTEDGAIRTVNMSEPIN